MHGPEGLHWLLFCFHDGHETGSGSGLGQCQVRGQVQSSGKEFVLAALKVNTQQRSFDGPS